jgi:hypothetical protein
MSEQIEWTGPDVTGGTWTESKMKEHAREHYEDSLNRLTPLQVGSYARSVESGWLGKIIGLITERVSIDGTRFFTETTAKMVGVDVMGTHVMGMAREESLSVDDIQWFAVDDLSPVS